jgi:hypothetical protein
MPALLSLLFILSGAGAIAAIFIFLAAFLAQKYNWDLIVATSLGLFAFFVFVVLVIFFVSRSAEILFLGLIVAVIQSWLMYRWLKFITVGTERP